ncbi:ECF RNA polymerase sigma factor SigK [Georgenia subflava]|uniref:Sigma-70 family RNA polymerase sigma factor n=1 Tax=Georgenia subflava TaxID=1622177 RepID=A0A6N7EMY1_9MICO|nr:ECF RNA polymerase sigma factor SigK [Georgenia subflava]MPV38801.1 sigma-70 family RNA polymerase sigma factor [Georgenia subflava]
MTSPGRAPSEGSTDHGGRADLVSRLLVEVADGDRHAFELLYDETAPMVHGAALRVLRDRELAAEVTQEVMVEVWRGAARFDPARGSALSWIVTVARRRAVDRVRSVQAQRDRDELASVRDYDRPFDDVAETVTRSEERDRVRNCLGTLTDLQREAVVRAYFGGRTYREVAEDVAATLPTVKSRIRDGLHRLRTCLGVDR